MNELEFWRTLFKDERLHLGIGAITQLGLSKDGNTLRAQVNLLPENREVVVEVTWDDYTRVTFPEVDDLVLVGFVDGHPDDGFLFKNLSNSDEPLAAFARAGHSIYYSRPGKKAYLGSNTKVGIGRPDVEPSEALVLGQTLVAGLQALVNAFLNAAAVGQNAIVGPVTLDPGVAAALQQFVQTYLTTASSNILSTIAFTERGS